MMIKEYREKVLKTMLKYEEQYNPSDQYEIRDALEWLYEEVRQIPIDSEYSN